MKVKQLFFLGLIGIFANNAIAQKSARFGIKAGLNFSHFNATVIAPPLSRIDDDNYFYVGGQIQIRFNKHFSLQPELFYVGSSVLEVASTAGPFERLHQLAVPVIAKYHIGKVSIYAGPQLDVLLQAEQHYFDASEQKGITKNVTDSSYNRAGLSAVAGLEWVFKYRFGIDVRYVLGLSNRSSANGTTILTGVDGQSIKINCIQAGLFFRFGKRPQNVTYEKKK